MRKQQHTQCQLWIEPLSIVFFFPKRLVWIPKSEPFLRYFFCPLGTLHNLHQHNKLDQRSHLKGSIRPIPLYPLNISGFSYLTSSGTYLDKPVSSLLAVKYRRALMTPLYIVLFTLGPNSSTTSLQLVLIQV